MQYEKKNRTKTEIELFKAVLFHVELDIDFKLLASAKVIATFVFNLLKLSNRLFSKTTTHVCIKKVPYAWLLFMVYQQQKSSVLQAKRGDIFF